MKPTTVVALLLVMLGLGAYVYFGIQVPHEHKQEEEKEAKKIFKDVSFSNVQKIMIFNKQESLQATFTKEKVGESGPASWWVEGAVSDLAAGSELDTLVTDVELLERTKVIDEAPKDLSPFGLKEPRATVEMTFGAATLEEKPQPPLTLMIGVENPSGKGLYVRSSLSKTVYMVDKGIDRLASKKLEEFREKKILNFPSTADLIELGFRKPAKPLLTITRADKEWRFTSPFERHTKTSEVDTVLTQLVTFRANTFIDGVEAKDLGRYGLARPDFELKLMLAEGKRDLRLAKLKGGSSASEIELLIGRVTVKKKKGKDTEYKYYATIRGLPIVFEVGKYQYETIEKITPASFIDKKIFEFVAGDVDTFRMTKGGDLLALKKAGVGQWTIQEPFVAEAEKARVEAIFRRLKDFKVQDILGTGKTLTHRLIPMPPQMEIKATFSKESGRAPFTLTFGDKLQSGNYVAVKLEGDDFIYSTEASDLGNLWVEPLEAKNKRLFSLNLTEPQHDRLVVTMGKRSLILEPKNKSYSAQEGDKTRPISSDLKPFKTFTEIYNQFRVRKFLPKAEWPKKKGDYGLGNPVLSIVWTDGQETTTVDIGNKSDKESGRYARMSGADRAKPRDVFLIEDWRFDSLKRQFEQIFSPGESKGAGSKSKPDEKRAHRES